MKSLSRSRNSSQCIIMSLLFNTWQRGYQLNLARGLPCALCSIIFCLSRIFFDSMQVAVGYSFITPFACISTKNTIRKCNYFWAKSGDRFPYTLHIALHLCKGGENHLHKEQYSVWRKSRKSKLADCHIMISSVQNVSDNDSYIAKK